MFKTKRKGPAQFQGTVKDDNKHPTYADNPLYDGCKDKLDLEHVDDVTKWANKSQSMNDGKTMWLVKCEGHLKKCGHEMGSGCGCPFDI